MGSSGSKPDWYPGEPADDSKAPPCLCSHAPHPAGGGETDNATPPATFRETNLNHGGGVRKETQPQKREITNLPVVSLTDMQYIANGAFCAVYACKYRGWDVVAKRVRDDLPLSERKAALANLWTEYDCLRKLHHPNVIDVYGMCRVRCREDYDDWNEKDVCLLVERLAFGTVGHLFGTIVHTEKNLASAMARSRKMKMVPLRCRLHRALELAQALEYMHGGSRTGAMMHRDIKSVNVGFARNGSLKLMDFGLSKIAPTRSTVDDTYKMTGEVGSYRYMAPELVRHEPYNSKVDIYSWAILSWEMLAIDKPYSGIGESTFVQKVVIGGGRPEFRKSWPDRLRKLLSAAWHPDHAKRPAASEVVAVLKIVEAELSAKEQRRPSYEASPAGTPAGCGTNKSGDGGSGSGNASRCHSWTQVSSADGRPTALSLTRPPSGSSTESGTETTSGGGAAQIPPLSSFASSPGPQTLATTKKEKKRASLPVPLPLTSSASLSPPASTRRNPSRWLSGRRKYFHSSSSAPTPAEKVVPALGKSRGPGGCSAGGSGSAGGDGGTGSLEAIVVGMVDGGAQEGDDIDDVDVDAQDRVPEWTTTATAAAAAAAAAATRADGGGCGDGRRCQLHRALISQRNLISDALARETEGLLSSGGAARVSSSTTATATTPAKATKAAPEPETERKEEPTKPRQVTAGGSSGGEENMPDSSTSTNSNGNSAGSQTAAKTRRIPSTEPAATIAAKRVLGAPAAPSFSRGRRHNSGLGRLWPSSSSEGRSKDKAAAAAAAAAAAEEVEGTQLATPSGATAMNGGGMKRANGAAVTTTG